MNAILHRNFITSDSAMTPKATGRSTTGRRALRMRLHLALVLLDICAVFMGFMIAHLLYQMPGEGQYLVLIAAIVPSYLLVAFKAEAFSIKTMRSSDFGTVVSMQSLIVAASLLLLIGFCTKQSENYSRVLVGVGVLGGIAMLALFRTIFACWSRSALGNPYEVVLISEDFDTAPEHDFTVRLPASDFDPKGDCPFMYDRLAMTLKDADRVIVACAPDRRSAWVNALMGANVQAEIFVPELAETKPMALAEHNGTPTIVVTKGPLKFPDRVTKRAIDATAALAALIVFSPIFAIVALAIKLDSRGPIFFVQTRIGRGNQLFKMIKFRSMSDNRADGQGAQSAARRDDRITMVGRFIRASSIDELPQLLNVLWGNMSIVGPRPHALGSRAENLLFWEIDARYWHRHSAKPGLTGLAQVRGYRGATSLRDDLTNRLDADLEYVNNWSLWNDFKIMFKTMGVMVHKNAY